MTVVNRTTDMCEDEGLAGWTQPPPAISPAPLYKVKRVETKAAGPLSRPESWTIEVEGPDPNEVATLVDGALEDRSCTHDDAAVVPVESCDRDRVEDALLAIRAYVNEHFDRHQDPPAVSELLEEDVAAAFDTPTKPDLAKVVVRVFRALCQSLPSSVMEPLDVPVYAVPEPPDDPIAVRVKPPYDEGDVEIDES